MISLLHDQYRLNVRGPHHPTSNNRKHIASCQKYCTGDVWYHWKVIMEWLNGDDALESINELLMKGHAVFNSEAPRPMRIPEEPMSLSQYTDGLDEEHDGPKLHRISEMLRKVEKVGSGDHLTYPKHFETCAADNFEVVLTKSNLNPQLTEFLPTAKQSSAETNEKSNIEIAKTEDESIDLKPPVVLKTDITPRREAPRRTNMAMDSLRKLIAMHSKVEGDAPAVKLRRPEDFLTPHPPMSSEPIASTTELNATLVGPHATPQSTARLDPHDLSLDADEKVSRWLYDKKQPNDSPKKSVVEVCISKPLMFMPKSSPAGSGPGSPASLASLACASPAPLPLPPSVTAASSRPARRGPTPYVPTAKADALYETYNKNKKLKDLAQPYQTSESRLENTIWAAVSKKLTEKEIHKNATTDAV